MRELFEQVCAVLAQNSEILAGAYAAVRLTAWTVGVILARWKPQQKRGNAGPGGGKRGGRRKEKRPRRTKKNRATAIR